MTHKADAPLFADYVQCQKIKALEKELQTKDKKIEKLESDIQWMVKKAADKSLEGYRELGQKCAELESMYVQMCIEYGKAKDEIRRMKELRIADGAEPPTSPAPAGQDTHKEKDMTSTTNSIIAILSAAGYSDDQVAHGIEYAMQRGATTDDELIQLALNRIVLTDEQLANGDSVPWEPLN